MMKSLSVFALAASAAGSALAADLSWTPNIQAAWTDTSAWAVTSGVSGSGFPQATDTAIFGGAFTGTGDGNVTLSGTQTVLNLNAFNTVNQDAIGINGTLNVLGTLTRNGGAAMSFRSSGVQAFSIQLNNLTQVAGTTYFGQNSGGQGLTAFSATGATIMSGGLLGFHMVNSGTAFLNSVEMSGGTLSVRQTSTSGTSAVFMNSLTGTAGTINTSGTASHGLLVVASGSTGGTLSASGNLDLIKTGTGTLILNSTVSSAVSRVIVNQGTLAYVTGGSADQLGSSTALIIDGGVVNMANRADAIGTFTLVSGTYTGGGTGRLNVGGLMNVQSGVISGGLLGVGGFLTKTTSGTVTTSGNHSYAGSTTLDGGVLAVTTIANGGGNSTLGASSSVAANLVLDGGILSYVGASAGSTDRQFTLGANGGGLDSSGSGALSFTSTSAATLSGSDTARTFTLGGTNTGANTFAGVLTDNGTGATSLTKNGAGTWVLTNDHTFTGTTRINGGKLQVGNGGTAGSLAGAILNNGNLEFNRSGTHTISNGIAGTGNVLVTGTVVTGTTGLAGMSIFNTANTFSGTVSASTLHIINLAHADAFQNATLAPGGSGRFTVDASVSSSGTITLGAFVGSNSISFGSRTLRVGGNNGDSIHSAGTFSASGGLIKEGTGVFTFSTTSNVNIAGGLWLNGGVFSLQSSVGLGTAVPQITFGGGILQYSAANTTDYSGTFSPVASGQRARIDTNGQNVAFASAITGAGGLQKLGSGTLTVSAASGYLGNTDISAGTLSLVGAGAVGAGNVAVDSGATWDVSGISAPTYTLGAGQILSGGGTIVTGAKTLVVDGTLAPGSSPGHLTVAGNLSLGATSTSLFEIDGLDLGQFDLLEVSGIFSVADGADLLLDFGTLFGSGITSLDLFNLGSFSGTFGSVALTGSYTGNLIKSGDVWTGVAGGQTFTFDQSSGILNASAIPEPGTVALLVLGGVGLLVRMRRLLKFVV